MQILLKLFIVLFSIIGLLQTSDMVFANILEIYPSPLIFGVPSSYILFYLYLILIVLPFIKQKIASILFFISIIIIFSLAFISSIGDMIYIEPCPRTKIGIPKCYISALLSEAILILGLFYYTRNS